MTFAMVSCGKNNETEQKEPTLSIVKSELSISGLGGEAFVEVESESQWSATVDKNWITCSQEGSKVTLRADKNPDLESRYATLVVKNAEEEIKLSIVQLGQKTSGFNPGDINISCEAAELKFPYKYDSKMEASVDASWITLDITDDCLTVRIAENTTTATVDNMARTAQISWALGADNGIINVLQRNVSFMQEDKNWTVEYQGVNQYSGKDYEFIAVNVADPAVSGMYGISLFSKADFIASKMEIADYIADVVAPQFIEEVDETIEYYAAQGQSLSFEDFLYEDSDYEIFTVLPAGDYYGVAIGFSADKALTGHYAYSAFTKKGSGGGGGATGYEAWLGEWKVTRGSETDTWTITQKTKGQTYNVTGIEGISAFTVEAVYDSANDSFSIPVQEGLTNYSSSYGTASIGIYGQIPYQGEEYFITGSYDIFTAKGASTGTAKMVPTTLEVEGIGECTLVNFLYLGELLDGSYAGQYLSFSEVPTELPNTMVKVGGSGGGDNPGDDNPGSGSADYNKFLGSYTVDPKDSSADPWTTSIRQDVADKSFKAYGWQGWNDDWMSPAEADFKDGAIVFKGGTGKAAATNVQVDDSGEAFSIYYMGRVEMGGKTYVITSGSNMYDACQGKVDNSGNIVLTGLDVTLSDNATYTFVDYSIVAMNADMSTIYTFVNMMNTFPVTMKKSGSGSSVKRMSISSKNAVKLDRDCLIDIAQHRSRNEKIHKAGRATVLPARAHRHIAK